MRTYRSGMPWGFGRGIIVCREFHSYTILPTRLSIVNSNASAPLKYVTRNTAKSRSLRCYSPLKYSSINTTQYNCTMLHAGFCSDKFNFTSAYTSFLISPLIFVLTNLIPQKHDELSNELVGFCSIKLNFASACTTAFQLDYFGFCSNRFNSTSACETVFDM